MTANLPRITLVTPSFQQGHFLAETIESVLDQGYANLQYIVVDGGSRDESVTVIKKYAKYLDWWASEADQGQSDALRKGFSRANGVLLNWLNSDDLLRPGALHAVAESWLASNADLIIGEDLPFTDNPAKPVGHFRPRGHDWPECLRFWREEFCYHQPCTFFSARAWIASGGIDTTLHYVMDYDLYCRILALPNCRVEILKRPLSAFRLHAEAKTSAQRPLFLDEQTLVSRRYWQLAGLDPASCDRELRAYTARCRFHQGVDSLRQRRLLEGLLRLSEGISTSPFSFLRHAAMRFAGSTRGLL